MKNKKCNFDILMGKIADKQHASEDMEKLCYMTREFDKAQLNNEYIEQCKIQLACLLATKVAMEHDFDVNWVNSFGNDRPSVDDYNRSHKRNKVTNYEYNLVCEFFCYRDYSHEEWFKNKNKGLEK